MVKIIIGNPNANIPNFMLNSDGTLTLDLSEKTTFALTKVIDDFAEPGTIKQDTFREVEFPITKKNRAIFGNIGNPSALNEDNSKIIDVQLICGSYSYPVQGLQVLEVSDVSNQYNCILFGELNNWFRPLSNLPLNELDMGTVVVDEIFLLDINTVSKYEDGEQPIVAPLVNYGKWFINHNQSVNSGAVAQVVFNNFRFWFSLKALMDQAFCQVGYSLISPFMDSDTFRQLFTYLLDPNFETANQLDIANRPFEATRSTDLQFITLFSTSLSGKDLLGVANMGSTPVTDPGGHYFTNPSGPSFPDQNFYGSFYSSGVIANFSFVGTVRFTPTNAPTIFFPVSTNFITLTISIRKAPKYGVETQTQLIERSTVLASKQYIDKGTFINGVVNNYDFDVQTEATKVYQHEVVFVFVELVADIADGSGNLYDASYMYPDTKILTGATFKNTVIQQVIEDGDTLELGKLLRSDLTAADLYKGVSHLYNFKTETDTIFKTVSMYPEFKIDLEGTDGIQEGFFLPNQDNPLDATNLIQANSLVEKPKSDDLGRNLYLKFLDSTDGYINQLGLSDQLHSKRVDLGEDYSDSENAIENPFFEPTANGIDLQLGGNEITAGAFIGQTSSIYIPFMWDGQGDEDGNYPDVGFDYTPRIAVWQGRDQQYIESQLTGFGFDTSTRYIYHDFDRVTVDTIGQIFPSAVGFNSAGTKITLDKAIVYGNGVNDLLKDLYQLIYERSIAQAYFTPSLDFLVKLSLIEFSNISFRRKWKVKYDSKAWGQILIYARIARIDDFVIGGNLTTPVQLLPDNNNFNKC